MAAGCCMALGKWGGRRGGIAAACRHHQKGWGGLGLRLHPVGGRLHSDLARLGCRPWEPGSSSRAGGSQLLPLCALGGTQGGGPYHPLGSPVLSLHEPLGHSGPMTWPGQGPSLGECGLGQAVPCRGTLRAHWPLQGQCQGARGGARGLQSVHKARVAAAAASTQPLLPPLTVPALTAVPCESCCGVGWAARHICVVCSCGWVCAVRSVWHESG